MKSESLAIKKYLRTKIKEKISKLDSNSKKLAAKTIQNIFQSLNILKKSNNIGLYLSKENEVSTKYLIKTLIANKKRIFLPKVNKENLEFKEIKTFKDLELGCFKIFEPKAKCNTINPSNLDLLIIPCSSVDTQGNRLGKGKGFYDRFLTKHKNIKIICPAFDLQVLNKIPHEKHDRRIDLIITEKRIIFPEAGHICTILDGKSLSNKIFSQLKVKIKSKKIKATLSVILVGDNPASLNYIKIKSKKCKEVGINFKLIKFKGKSYEGKILTKIKKLNLDPQTSGIIVQLPLPKHLSTQKIINSISHKKDVDGLTKKNQIKFLRNKKHFPCCTPQAILSLLKENKISLQNKNIVLVGYGNLVGKPLAQMLKKQNIKFTVCDEKTTNIKRKTLQADILISATGVPHLIDESYIKEKAIIIDAGSSKFEGKIVGDVNFNSVITKAAFLSPVPGGVGPMTVAMLLNNTSESYTRLNT